MARALERNITDLHGLNESFSDLYRKHEGLAFSIAFKFTSSPHDAQDIVQTAFKNIWERLYVKGGEIPENFASYLSRVVHNTAISRSRKNWYKKVEHFDDPDALDRMEGGQRAFVDRSTFDSIWSVIDGLGDYGQILEKNLEVDSGSELGKFFPGLSGSSVRVRLRRARLKLKKILLEAGLDFDEMGVR